MILSTIAAGLIYMETVAVIGIVRGNLINDEG
jgi:hypothetical protein